MTEKRKQTIKKVIIIITTLASFLLGAKHPQETEQVLTTITDTIMK